MTENAAAPRVKAACIQLTSSPDPEANIAALRPLLARAREAGAELIATPENVLMIEPKRAEKFEKAEDPANPRLVPAFAGLAREFGVWLLAGSLTMKIAGEDRLWNRSHLFDPAGTLVAAYDKIHMFDVDLANGESYRESSQFRPGERAVLADSPWGGIGLTVCYDIRFGALYRALAQAGAGIITVPAAFTVPTGEAHWHTLLRARAIENGCFILAPAQTGTHADGRRTFGHSLIVTPWGEVLADAGTDIGFIAAELDLGRIAQARNMVPSLRHDRVWDRPARLRPDGA